MLHVLCVLVCTFLPSVSASVANGNMFFLVSLLLVVVFEVMNTWFVSYVNLDSLRASRRCIAAADP